MDLPVPEHVRPIRDKFSDFIHERVIPVESELYTWWEHLGGGRRLCLLTVRRGGQLVAIAPLAVTPARLRRRPAHQVDV